MVIEAFCAYPAGMISYKIYSIILWFDEPVERIEPLAAAL
jgi:hypothetical protein